MNIMRICGIMWGKRFKRFERFVRFVRFVKFNTFNRFNEFNKFKRFGIIVCRCYFGAGFLSGGMKIILMLVFSPFIKKLHCRSLKKKCTMKNIETIENCKKRKTVLLPYSLFVISLFVISLFVISLFVISLFVISQKIELERNLTLYP
jgi:hypothetical protein